jgi:hypothetical protein
VSGDVADPGRLTLVQQPLVKPDIVLVRSADPGSTPAQAALPLRVDTVLASS